MAQLSEKAAKRVAERAWSRKQQWRSLHKEVFEYCFPNRDTFDTFAPGQEKNLKHWDSTAPAAIMSGANRLNELTPAFQNWIVLEPGAGAEIALKGDEVKLKELTAELQGAAKMANAMLHVGGFSVAVHEMYMDWLVSTGGMLVQEGSTEEPEGPLAIFTAVPLSQFMVEEGPGGDVIRKFRWHEVEGDDLSMFPRIDASKFPEQIKEALADPDRAAKVKLKLIEIEYKDPSAAPEVWRYEIFLEHGDKQTAYTRVMESKGRTGQLITPRYAKYAGEHLGRGPAIAALPDIRTANKVVELTFRAAALNLLGIYTAVARDGLNPANLQLVPGAVMAVPTNGGPNGPSVQRLDTGATTVNFAELLLDGVRMNIKKLLMDNQLPPDAGPVKSATEIVQRMRELAMDLGGAYGRLVHEFVLPLVQRLLDILHRRGLLADAIKVDQFFVQVSVSSPLAREQALGTVDNIIKWASVLQQLGGRELLTLATRLEDLGEYIGRLMSIPEDLIRPEKGEGGREEMQKNMASAVAGGVQPGAGAAGGAPGAGPVPIAA